MATESSTPAPDVSHDNPPKAAVQAWAEPVTSTAASAVVVAPVEATSTPSPPAAAEVHPKPPIKSIAFVVFVGMVGAVQAAMNTRAGKHFGLPYFGSFISFAGGWLVLLALVLVELHKMKAARAAEAGAKGIAGGNSDSVGLAGAAASTTVDARPLDGTAAAEEGAATTATTETAAAPAPAPAAPEKPLGLLAFSRRPTKLQCLPGAFGALFVTATVVVSSVTGYAIFFIASTLGQLLCSTYLDSHALFGAPLRPMTKQKTAALVIALLGAVLTVAERLSSGPAGGASGVAVLAAVLFGTAAASLLPIQASINRGVADLLPSKLQATLFSFSVGTLCIGVVLVLALIANPDIAAAFSTNFRTSSWWMYCGGPGGVLYIGSGIWLIRKLGAAVYFVALVSGQLLGSVIADAVTGGAAATPLRVFGVLLVIAAALIMQAKPEIIAAVVAPVAPLWAKLTGDKKGQPATTGAVAEAAV